MSTAPPPPGNPPDSPPENPPVAATAAAIVTEALALVRRRPPTLGRLRLLAVDGPAGSGKTTLAERLVAAAPGSALVHVDDLLDGWDGLPRVGEAVRAALLPLAAGGTGTYTRYDWVAGAPGETVRLTAPPSGLVVLEGVGAAGPRVRDLATAIVWVEAGSAERLRRGLARDGAHLAPEWGRFRVAEQAHFAAAGTRAHADLHWWTGTGPSTGVDGDVGTTAGVIG